MPEAKFHDTRSILFIAHYFLKPRLLKIHAQEYLVIVLDKWYNVTAQRQMKFEFISERHK